MTAPKGTPAPTLPDLCRAAATAIETLCATLRDCVREVENRGGQRVARDRLHDDVRHSVRIVWDLQLACIRPGVDPGVVAELDDMIEGCREGFVRETWALRLMQLAAGAEGPRDTVPAEAPLCACGDAYPIGHPQRCVAIATHRCADGSPTFSCEEHADPKAYNLSWVRIDDDAPEEHAGEGGT